MNPSPAFSLPASTPPSTRRWTAVFVVLVAATVLGLVEASQVQYDRAVQGVPITWGHALIHGLPRWYAWALLLPGIFAVSDGVRRRGLGWPATLAVHALAAVLVTALQILIFSSVSTALHGEPGLVAHLRPAFLKYVGLTFLGGLITYAVLVLGRNAWHIYRQGRVREHEAARLELRAAELKALLAETQLGHLQSQLQPHFLFNALHTLNALIGSGESEAAGRMTRRMADFLRRSLRLAGRPEIPVSEELELLEHYLGIQRARFGERLRVTVDADADAMEGRVPTLFLQPIVENAIRHGIERKADAGAIEVSVVRRGSTLHVRVRDDGPGPEARTADSEGGLGLENTRARLEELHGEDAVLKLVPAPGGGAEVRIALPFRMERTAGAATP